MTTRLDLSLCADKIWSRVRLLGRAVVSGFYPYCCVIVYVLMVRDVSSRCTISVDLNLFGKLICLSVIID